MASSSRWGSHRTVTIVVAIVLAIDLIACASFAAEWAPSGSGSGSGSGNRKRRLFDYHVHRREERVDNGKIIGGGRANRTAFPYIALLTIWKENQEFFCGGTLLDREHVVTAAHCLVNSSALPLPPSAITVYVGGLDLKKGQKVGVSRLWTHPSFTFYENDVALLKLKTALKITPNVMPIKVSNGDSSLVQDSDLTIAGWGSVTADGTSPAANLLAATINHLPNGCGKYKKPDTSEYVGSLMICAGCATGRVDTCQGDSGGPLTAVSASMGCPILAGLTSFGEGCALPDYPGVYTRLSSQLAWLERQAGRLFRSQYAMAPSATCDTCAGATKGKCGLAPAFDSTACQIEGYLASAFLLRMKACSRASRLQAGGSLPLEAAFNPASFGTFKPQGFVYFLRAQSTEGSSQVDIEGVKVNVPFKGPVESRNGTVFSNYWRVFWPADADAPNKTCSNYFAYAAAYVSSDKKYIQVTLPMRSNSRR